ncbi:MAG: phosphopantetheine-binding protein [Planctomycetota bacterium]|jgi:acyl carrier protein
MTTETLEADIKALIIEALALEDVTPADIESAAPLFGEGLGLDSIDALELAMALQKRYGVKAEGSAEENRRHFASVQSLAAMIRAHRAQTGSAS